VSSFLAASHPQVVHFAVALVFVGVAFRLLALTRRVAFANLAAATLVMAGTIACFAAVHTGTLAHGPVERIPGARQAVVDHEEWGERTRNLFVIISMFELMALVLASYQHRLAYIVSVGSAVAGLGGLVAMYETAQHGGELVYAYAGGVGTRSGNPEDVSRLFVAGTYQQALLDREQGRHDEAMALIEMAATRFSSNLDLQLMAVEWTTEVRHDPAQTLRRIDALQIPAENTRARVRAGLARTSALLAMGNRDGATAVLRTLLAEFPTNAQVKRRLDELSAPAQ
jgi:uncharacterized membrane protein